jgi:transcriptional regulator with XRE-family HTH domain
VELQSIELELRDLLADPARRRDFFRSITQDEIASAIREMRKLRHLTQVQLATKTEMKQSAVSRIEQAEHASWSLTTLFRVADALDARWRVSLQPCEQASDELLRAVENTAVGGLPTNVATTAAGTIKGNLLASASDTGSSLSIS